MGRDYVIYGETMVKVKGMDGDTSPLASLQELGLCDGEIRITPNFYHKDINCDDFGPNVPAEVMFNLADVTISMTLVHFDDAILDACINNSMAGSSDGTLAGAGTLMGNNKATLGNGNFFISLNLVSTQLGTIRFPTSYLAVQPEKLPIGTKRSLVELNWRAIPYKNLGSSATPTEPISKGAILWSFTGDT